MIKNGHVAICDFEQENQNSGGGSSIDLSDYAKKTEVADAIKYAHNHENKETLDGVTSEKIAVWDAAAESIGDI